MKKKIKSLKTNAVLNLIKTLMSLIFPLITFPYTSRIIGPIYIGKVNFSLSIVQYFTLLSGLGIASYATREIARVRDNYDELCRKTAEIFRINFFSMLFAYFLFFITLLFVPKLSEYKTLLLILSTTIILNPFGMDWINNALEDFGYITLRTILCQIISIFLLFTTVHSKDDYLKYAAINVISVAGANLLNFFHVRKYISYRYFFSKLNIKQHLKPILILFAMAITTQIYSIIDNLMLGFLKNDYNVGLYTAATKLNKLVLSLVTACTGILLPRLSYYIKNETFEKFKKLAYKGFDIICILSIPCSIGLNIISKNAVTLISGQEFQEAIPVMKIMNPIIVITSISSFISSQIFLPLDKEKWSFLSAITGVFFNIILNLIFIPIYGARGAALGTLFSETIMFFINFILLSKIIKITPIIKKIFIYLINTIIMAIPTFFISKQLQNIYLNLTGSVICGIITYLVVLIIEKNPMLYSILDILMSKIKKNGSKT